MTWSTFRAELGRRRDACRDWLRHGDHLGLVVALALLALILAAAAGLRLETIEKSLPYPRHIDEPLLTEPAANMLKTGDFNPHFFMYPAFPTYLTAIAYTGGFVSAATHGDLSHTAEIGHMGYPFYYQERLIRPAFLLFVFLALLSLAGIGYIGYELARRAGSGSPALVLGPLALFFSATFFEYSQLYLNVNLFGDAFFWCLLAFLFWKFEDSSWNAKVLFPGLLAGAVLACKYNFLWIVVPPLLVLSFHGGQRRAVKAFWLLVLTGLTFLCLSPYCLLDFSGFLNDFAKIASIYQEGFVANEAAPGWPQFGRYATSIIRDFGWASLPFFLLGLVAAWRACWRRTLVLIAFPGLVLWHMSQQKAHFLRNVLSAFPLYALLFGLGILAAARLLDHALAPRLAQERHRRLAGAAAVVLALFLILPIGNIAHWRSVAVDSRKQVSDWIEAKVSRKTTIVVPHELSMDTRALSKAGYQVEGFRLQSYGAHESLARFSIFDDALILMPELTSGHWDPKTAATKVEVAEDLALLSPFLKVEHRLGKHAGSVIFQHIMTGDPKIHVARLELDDIDRRGLPERRWVPVESFKGKTSQLDHGRLFIFAGGNQESDPFELEPGKYRALLTCLGSRVNERAARLRLALGEMRIGFANCNEQVTGISLDFSVAAKTEAPFVVELVNDEVEKLVDGSIRDRNVYLRSLVFYPLPSSTNNAE